MRVGQYGFHIDAGEGRDGNRVGDEARDHRRIHHVRRAPVAEQEFASSGEARAGLSPQLEDAVDLLDHRTAQFARGIAFAHVHRQFAAQIGESRMHFGGHRSRHSARGFLLGPIFLAPGPVGEEFDDRQTVPHHAIAVPQDRDFAQRRGKFVAFAPFFPRIVEHRHDQFLKRLARLFDREPAAHRPAGISPVADDQLEQGDAPFMMPMLRARPRAIRRFQRRFRSM